MHCVLDRFAAQALWAALALAGLLVFPCSAGAAAAPATAEPVLELTVLKVLADASGAERLVPADTARAGDTLEYTAVYVNSTAKPIRGAQVTLPVPANGVEYRLGSATSSPALAPLASRDGQTFAAIPLMRVERGSDGKSVLRPAPAADYRLLRWQLGDLAPGTTRTVRARVQLLPVGDLR